MQKFSDMSSNLVPVMAEERKNTKDKLAITDMARC